MPRPPRIFPCLLPALCALLVTVYALPAAAADEPEKPIRVALVGLVHGHAKGFLC